MSRRQLPSLIRVHCERRQVISRAYLSRFNARYYNPARGFSSTGRPPRSSTTFLHYIPLLSHPPQVLSCATVVNRLLSNLALLPPTGGGGGGGGYLSSFLSFFLSLSFGLNRHRVTLPTRSIFASPVRSAVNKRTFLSLHHGTLETFLCVLRRIRVCNKIVYNEIRAGHNNLR